MFDERTINDCFVYLVAIIQALVDRFVSVNSQISVTVWMKGSSCC